MPYVITTLTPSGPRVEHPKREWFGYVRRAVATLEEAREECYHGAAECPRYSLSVAVRISRDIDSLPEAGGTVGPLPDGTVIEVKRATWQELAIWPNPTDPPYRTAIIDAYNARSV